MSSREHRQPSHTTKESPWKPDWFSNIPVMGKYQIPVLYPYTFITQPTGVNSLHRQPPAEARATRVIHGFEDDKALMPILDSPKNYLTRYSKYTATIAPDFSLRTGMPLQDRIRSVWSSRAVGAYFQTHGLNVLPVVRWTEMSDFDFVLDGLSTGGAIALSIQSSFRDKELRKTFEEGCEVITSTLRPQQIIFYGTMTSAVNTTLTQTSNVWQFDTDMSRVHRERNA